MFLKKNECKQNKQTQIDMRCILFIKKVNTWVRATKKKLVNNYIINGKLKIIAMYLEIT